MVKGVIFDMDGVLVDNLHVHTEAFAEMARRYETGFDVARFLSLSGKGNREIFAELFPAEVVERVGWQKLGEEKEAVYRQLYAPDLKPARGLPVFLEELRAAGVKMAVGSSAMTANINFVLDGLGIRHYFEVIVNADKVTRTKPDPEIYLLALAELGLAAEECVVFEDAVAGIIAAREAGIKVVALSTTEPAEKLAAQRGVAGVVADFTEINAEKLNSLAEVGA